MTNRFNDAVQKLPVLLTGLPLRRFGLLVAALISVCAYPVLFVYFHNIGEAVLAQVFSPILIFAAVGLVAWLIFSILSGKMSKGACVALLFLLVFINYSLLEDRIRLLVPDWRWWRIAPAFLFLFINLSLILRVFVKRPEGDAAFTKIAAIIGSVFLALTLFNAARGIYTLASTPRIDSRPAAVAPQQAEELPPADSGKKHPNFYFFIFDEYSRQDVLKNHLDYDNTPFLNGLAFKRFNVSYSSYSNSIMSEVSTGNLLYYSDKFKNKPETMGGIKRPPLFEIFKKAGYKTYALSPLYQIDKKLMDIELIATTVLTALSIKKTVLAKSFIPYLHQDENECYRADQLSLLKQAAAIVAEKTEKPKFLYFHFMGPHVPFVFNENGDPVAWENMFNFVDTQFYTGQLRFLSKKIDALTSTIIEQDPGAVVLIQSDHGTRWIAATQEKEKFACLNNLYFGGKTLAIEGISTINTLRLALNHTLGLKLAPLRTEQ